MLNFQFRKISVEIHFLLTAVSVTAATSFETFFDIIKYAFCLGFSSEKNELRAETDGCLIFIENFFAFNDANAIFRNGFLTGLYYLQLKR